MLHADGGPTRNEFLMQFTADIAGVELVVVRRAGIVGPRRRDGRAVGAGRRAIAGRVRRDAAELRAIYRPQMDRDTVGATCTPVGNGRHGDLDGVAHTRKWRRPHHCRIPGRNADVARRRGRVDGRRAVDRHVHARARRDGRAARALCRPRRIDRSSWSRCPPPSLPGAAAARRQTAIIERGRVRLSFPLENMGANLPAIISTVAGNLFELRYLSGLRLLDLEFPASLASDFPGPQFGVAGTRRLTGVYDRPIIGTIVKPSIGSDARSDRPIWCARSAKPASTSSKTTS